MNVAEAAALGAGPAVMRAGEDASAMADGAEHRSVSGDL
jgi:hypothetical protein